jgi:fatty acid desaturase
MSATGLQAADATVTVNDIREAGTPWYSRLVAPLVIDPRDVVFVGLMAQCLALGACGVGLFFAGPRLWYFAPVYWVALVFGLLDRFTLMLHCTSHRQLFKPKYRALNYVIPWVIGPFFGQTPDTYFAHHMGMHHNEGNMPEDLSSTLRFQRDRFGHWLMYWGRFMTVGLPDLCRYMLRKNRSRLFRRIVVGEGAYWSTVAVLGYFNLGATVAVFLAPLVVIRSLMMMGNWGQHAFVASADPDNDYHSSITCINSRYNRRCFNDGYHIGHHLSARAHWTELPVEFDDNQVEYGRQDAIVFEGIDFFMVWLFLMTGSWSRLARAFVQLPGAPRRNEAEIIAFLKSRMRPVSVTAAPIALPTAAE